LACSEREVENERKRKKKIQSNLVAFFFVEIKRSQVKELCQLLLFGARDLIPRQGVDVSRRLLFLVQREVEVNA